MSVVNCQNISHAYTSGEKVLHDVNFSLDIGQSMVITGPSGSGKSTLLGILSLLITPSEGQLTYHDTAVQDLKESEKCRFRQENIGYVRQDLALLPDRDVLENVTLPLLIQGKLSKRERLERGRAILDQVGLTPQLHSRVDRISGGQRQRLAIARALIADPTLILADEPTAQLDEANAHSVTELLQKSAQDHAVLIFATHDLSLTSSFDHHLHLRSIL